MIRRQTDRGWTRLPPANCLEQVRRFANLLLSQSAEPHHMGDLLCALGASPEKGKERRGGCTQGRPAQRWRGVAAVAAGASGCTSTHVHDPCIYQSSLL